MYMGQSNCFMLALFWYLKVVSQWSIKKFRSNSFDLSCLFASRLKTMPRGRLWMAVSHTLLIMERNHREMFCVIILIYLCNCITQVRRLEQVRFNRRLKQGVKNKEDNRDSSKKTTTKQIGRLADNKIIVSCSPTTNTTITTTAAINTSDHYTLYSIQKQQI